MGYRYPLAAVPPVLSALGGVLHPCAPFAPSVGGGKRRRAGGSAGPRGGDRGAALSALTAAARASPLRVGGGSRRAGLAVRRSFVFGAGARARACACLPCHSPCLPCRPGLGGGARGLSCASPGLWRERAAPCFPCSPPRAATGRHRGGGRHVCWAWAQPSLPPRPRGRPWGAFPRGRGASRERGSGRLAGREAARGPFGVCGCWRRRVEAPRRRGSRVRVGEDAEGRRRRAPVSLAVAGPPWRVAVRSRVRFPGGVRLLWPEAIPASSPSRLRCLALRGPGAAPTPPRCLGGLGRSPSPPPGEGGLFEGSAPRVPVGALWGWGLSVTGGGGGGRWFSPREDACWLAVAEARRPPVGRVRCRLPIPRDRPCPRRVLAVRSRVWWWGCVCSGVTGRLDAW
ncbi:uncharacterized protein LOC133754863 [Lepus europaeus]|uniref:uncharacterized protein LOC133754863 n=1 Tax=Lepus europaeus TaxID=9983 RepID=UPI002B470F48|nr:uncharacterized protein LOC133754863 [Lepus europaeus]XP_062041220.1 uncharacterized protein LOC133754863 [Lepus europaeus]